MPVCEGMIVGWNSIKHQPRPSQPHNNETITWHFSLPPTYRYLHKSPWVAFAIRLASFQSHRPLPHSRRWESNLWPYTEVSYNLICLSPNPCGPSKALSHWLHLSSINVTNRSLRRMQTSCHGEQSIIGSIEWSVPWSSPPVVFFFGSINRPKKLSRQVHLGKCPEQMFSFS